MKLRPVLLFLVPALLVIAGVAFWLQGGRYEETENAYVKANIVAVSADVSGRVIEVGVRDNQPVAAGALLFRIDPAPFRLELERTEAQLAVARTELEGMRAEYRVAQAEAAEAADRIVFLARQLERQEKLRERGMGLEASYDEALHNLEAARLRLEGATERARRVQASLGGDLKLPVQDHPRYRQALAARDAARDDLGRTTVSAPSAGVVSNMKLQAGERVERGVPIFTLVEQGQVWIEANFKETQLTHMREGQSASLSADAYPNLKWTGKVKTIAPATRAEFALLPPQNASGNWVKIVQRVPVLVDLERASSDLPPLRAGMTVTVRVDTGHQRSLAGAFRAAMQ